MLQGRKRSLNGMFLWFLGLLITEIVSIEVLFVFGIRGLEHRPTNSWQAAAPTAPLAASTVVPQGEILAVSIDGQALGMAASVCGARRPAHTSSVVARCAAVFAHAILAASGVEMSPVSANTVTRPRHATALDRFLAPAGSPTLPSAGAVDFRPLEDNMDKWFAQFRSGSIGSHEFTFSPGKNTSV
jgi:hypothetical protein